MKRLRQLRPLTRESAQLFGVGTVDREIAKSSGILGIAVNAQILRDAAIVGELAERDGVVHRVFRHVPVGRPLAAGHRQQAGWIDVNRVIAR